MAWTVSVPTSPCSGMPPCSGKPPFSSMPSSPSRMTFAPQESSPLTETFRPCIKVSSPARSLGLGLDESSPMIPKRKMNLCIKIPKATDQSLAALEKALNSDGRKEVVEEGEGFAVCSKRGRKKVHSEDRYDAVPDAARDTKTALFAIFDGHSGKEASEFCSKNMANFILNELEKTKYNGGTKEIEEAVKIGYLKTDQAFLNEFKEEHSGGACCLTAILHNGNLVISNAGDCRAVLSTSGVAEAVTSDHRLSRMDERERVEKLGAFVDFRKGIYRLQGSLAVCRGIGDAHLKKWVTPEPETRIIKIQPESEFVILASDGLWDKVTNQEAVDFVRPFYTGKNKALLLTACEELANLSITRGSLDDTSVMIIELQEFAIYV